MQPAGGDIAVDVAVTVSETTIRTLGLAYLAGGLVLLVLSVLGWGNRLLSLVVALVAGGYGSYIVFGKPDEIFGSFYLLVAPVLIAVNGIRQHLAERQATPTGPRSEAAAAPPAGTPDVQPPDQYGR